MCEMHCTFFHAKLNQASVRLMKMYLATVARISKGTSLILYKIAKASFAEFFCYIYYHYSCAIHSLFMFLFMFSERDAYHW